MALALPTWLRTVFAPRVPIWLHVLRTSALVVLSFIGLDRLILPALPSRALTANETHMLREVFGKSVDYSKVRIHHSRLADIWLRTMDTAAMTRRNMITMPRGKCSADYAKCSDKAERSVFIHESVHVWQGQNRIMPAHLTTVFGHYGRMLRGVAPDAHYNYSLKGQRALTSYNVEQQAGIIADYVMYVKDKPLSEANRNMLFLNTDASRHEGYDYRADYERVLKPFLRNPAYVRK